MKFFFIIHVIFTLSIFSEICEYKYEPKNTKLKWQAFKFTERVGLEGTFETIQVQQLPKVQSIKDLSESIRFKIDTQSLNTNHPERDQKIKNFFFGNLNNSNEIIGEFKNFKMSEENGKVDLILKINAMEAFVPVEFILRKKKYLELHGNLNVVQWQAGRALEILNKECSSVHKGKDGISKVWNDIDFYLFTELIVICKP